MLEDVLNTYSIEETAIALREKKITATELLHAVLQRIQITDDKINAYITINQDGAKQAAEESDKRISAGKPLSLLDGIPVAVKDNFLTNGLRTTCASKMLKNYVPPIDAFAVEKLRLSGAVITGKTNMDEFAMGCTGENSVFGPTRNPWSNHHTPGGSSSGSAAALAYGGCIGAIGSDTSGSVRQPASFCGLVGLKPTYGQISRFGVTAAASSMDQVGTITRTTRDAAIMLQHISGHDPRDMTSTKRSVPNYLDSIEKPICGKKIAVLHSLYENIGLNHEVLNVLQKTEEALREKGAELIQAALPHLKYAIAVYNMICAAEVSTNMTRFDGIRFGERVDGHNMWDTYRFSRGNYLGYEVKLRMLMGTHILSADHFEAYFLQAARVRELIRRELIELLKTCDAILLPVSPEPAFRIGAAAQDAAKACLNDIFTVAANLTGLPALSFPAGIADGVPTGVQLIGRPYQENELFCIARNYELARPEESFAYRMKSRKST